ncbi:MAG: DUF4276 family protein [Treponema sp.]|nr:DUF4276 family protein [Treponema sp.]
MTIYLHCEGITDYAVIPHLIKKVLKNNNLDIQWVKRDVLKKIRTYRKSNISISGHYKFIKSLATYSLLNKSKYIAYHQDGDGKYGENYNNIICEFIPLKQNGIRCLAIVPKETIESWLLADEKAFPSKPSNPKLPLKPEELWGQRNDSYSNHPKNVLLRVLNQFNLIDNSDTYAQIAESADIKALESRCPISFRKFIKDTQEFLL